jgi:hypothetical protein
MIIQLKYFKENEIYINIYHYLIVFINLFHSYFFIILTG